jgi:hypothetical protein
MRVLRQQREHVKGNEQYEEAYRSALRDVQRMLDDPSTEIILEEQWSDPSFVQELLGDPSIDGAGAPTQESEQVRKLKVALISEHQKNRRLEEKNRQLVLKKRDLQQQLRDIRASKIGRSLTMLAYVRAKVARKGRSS